VFISEHGSGENGDEPQHSTLNIQRPMGCAKIMVKGSGRCSYASLGVGVFPARERPTQTLLSQRFADGGGQSLPPKSLARATPLCNFYLLECQ